MQNPSRQEIAKSIIAAPTNYKVCEVCGSVVSVQADICPNCNAYRFNSSPDFVVEQAITLASREQRSVAPGDLA